MGLLEPDQIVATVIGLSQHDPVAVPAQQGRGLGEASLGQGGAIGVDQAYGGKARGQQVLGRMQETLTEIGPALRQQVEARRQEVVEGSGIIGRGESDDAHALLSLGDLATFAAMSRMKHRLSSAASSALSGGIRRVFTLPTRGAFAIKTKAVGRSPTAHCRWDSISLLISVFDPVAPASRDADPATRT